MRDDSFPAPVSDPEAEGLPDTADDDSTAYDDVETVRFADGPDPAALPADRPVPVDRFGLTPAEEEQGESLDQRLAEEVPDPALQVPVPPDPGMPGEPVGRLVAPDEGAHDDEESAEVASDAGSAGGGPTAEEAAMHTVPGTGA
jgi:hypothetical protein